MSGAVDVGRLGLALAVTAPFFMFMSLRLRFVYGADVSGRFRPSDYVTARFACSLIAALLSIAFGLALYRTREWLPILAAIAAFKIVESISDVLLGAHQIVDRQQRIMFSQIVAGTGYLVAFVVGYGLFGTLFASCTLALALRVLTMVFDTCLFRRSVRENVRPEFSHRSTVDSIKSLVVMTGPLSFAGLFDSVSTSLPRLAAANWCTASDLGIFVAVNYIGVAFVMASSSVIYSHVTSFASLHATGFTRDIETRLWRFSVAIVAASLVAEGFVFLFGERAISLAYGEAFVAGKQLLCWTIASAGLISVALGGVAFLTAIGRYRSVTSTYLAYTVILALALLISGPSGDINTIGAAIFVACTAQVLIVSSFVIFDLRAAARDGSA
jgi:O-antigen/teichoic acid export membrane protein